MVALHTNGNRVWLYPSSVFNYVRLHSQKIIRMVESGDIVEVFTDRLIALEAG